MGAALANPCADPSSPRSGAYTDDSNLVLLSEEDKEELREFGSAQRFSQLGDGNVELGLILLLTDPYTRYARHTMDATTTISTAGEWEKTWAQLLDVVTQAGDTFVLGLSKRISADPHENLMTQYNATLPLYYPKKELVLEYFASVDKDGDGSWSEQEIRSSAMFSKALAGWDSRLLRAKGKVAELTAQIEQGAGDEYFETVEKEAAESQLRSWVSQLQAMEGKTGDTREAACALMLTKMIDKRGLVDGKVSCSEFLMFVMDGESRVDTSPTRGRAASIWTTLEGTKACWREPSLDAWKATMEARGVLWASDQAMAAAEGAQETFEVVVDQKEYPPKEHDAGNWT